MLANLKGKEAGTDVLAGCRADSVVACEVAAAANEAHGRNRPEQAPGAGSRRAARQRQLAGSGAGWVARWL